MKKLIAISALVFMIPMLASAQTEDHPYRGQGYGFFGLGTGLNDYHPVAEQAGFGGEGFLFKGFAFGAEAAYSHYNTSGGFGISAWIGSLDPSYHFGRHAARRGVDPFILGGFSLYGPTSKGGGRGQPGGNFGGGVNLWLAEHAALRLEIREHVAGFSYLPSGTAIAFRVAVTFR